MKIYIQLLRRRNGWHPITVSAICRKNHYEEIDPMYCDLKSRPETGIFSCNQNPCPPRFV
jgi:hypothetical protein